MTLIRYIGVGFKFDLLNCVRCNQDYITIYTYRDSTQYILL